MIHKISIKNFKSIVDLELELGRLNVFIGENGCGKTNILEAITCGSVAAESGMLYKPVLSIKGVRIPEERFLSPAFEKLANQKQEFPSITLSNHLKETYKIQFLWFDGVIKSPRNLKPETKEYVKKMKNNAEFKSNFTLEKLFGKNVWELFHNYAPENYFLRRFEEEGQIKPLGIRGEGLFKHLVEIYKKKPEILEKIGEKLRLIGWFQGFEIPKDLMFTERRINIKDKYLQELDYFDQRSANEGFLYLLFYFTLFISPFTPRFFAIDNIDNSLNPKLCAELVRQLAIISKENDKQAILTTHNPAVLDGLNLEDGEQRLFTIYRNAEGHTVARRIMPPKKIKGVESVRLSEAFIRGYLGGLPKNF